jgi:hypothetical protein
VISQRCLLRLMPILISSIRLDHVGWNVGDAPGRHVLHQGEIFRSLHSYSPRWVALERSSILIASMFDPPPCASKHHGDGLEAQRPT